MVETTQERLAAIIRVGFLPILVDDDLDPLLLADLCLKAGIPALEYSLRREDIRQKVPALKAQWPHLIVLAASTLDDEKSVAFLKRRRDFTSLDELHQLGVEGVVSMHPFHKETYDHYRGEWIFIPGVETGADALEQLSWGAHLIKFFNAEVYGGPRRIATFQGASHGIFPIVATGGMTVNRIAPYIEAGALAVAAGFDLILGDRYQQMQQRPDGSFIRERLQAYVETVREARVKAGQAHWGSIQEPEALLQATGRCFPL